MPLFLKPVMYGSGVFSVFIVITFILRFATQRMPQNPDLFGYFTINDLLLGLVVAIVLTFSRERKRKINKIN